MTYIKAKFFSFLLLGGCFLFTPFFSLHGESDAPMDQARHWTDLLDSELTQWDVFMGVPHGSLGMEGIPTDSNGKSGIPLGLKVDPLNVFTVEMRDAEPVLHISGEIYGGLSTQKEYGDYHIRMQMRWGTKKYEPRLDRLRDSGILYHCYGPHGAFWNVWMESLECQVQESDIGDFYGLGGIADIPAVVHETPAGRRPVYRYEPGASLETISGRCVHGEDYFEKENGEWNTIEILCVGDRSIHILNGRVVNVLQNLRRPLEGLEAPLVKGKIQIQSEGAEVEYRRIEIREVETFPTVYQSLFSE